MRAFPLALLLPVMALAAARTPMVAVMPLALGPGVDSGASQVISEALSDELLRTGKARIMERSQMEAILREQGFQQSGACDANECAVEVGKLLSIDRMVVGSLGRLGGSYSLSVRLVDVQTGEVLGSSRRMQRGEIDEVVAKMLPALARELADGLSADPAPTASSSPDSSRRIWPWIVGGAVVAGGAATAAILLSSGDGSSPATTGNVEAGW